MIKPILKFSAIQIIALLLSFFVLTFALVGSHGRLYFSNAGGTVALIMTIILSIPLICLFSQRHKLRHRKLSFIIATVIFILAMSVIYVGLPHVTKRFIIDKQNINKFSIYRDADLTISFALKPEMFDRVGIEASINKTNIIQLDKLDLTVYNDKGGILKPVFKPLAWDSLHHETIQMDSLFEINNFSKMNKFALSGQYSIEHSNSLKIRVAYTFSKNGQITSDYKELGIRITNHLTMVKLIKY
jgi:hypothetical protein